MVSYSKVGGINLWLAGLPMKSVKILYIECILFNINFITQREIPMA